MNAKTDVEHFRLALKRSGTTIDEFAYLARQRQDRAREWLHGNTDIPGWVLGYVGMLAIPEAKAVAKQAADFLSGAGKISAAE